MNLDVDPTQDQIRTVFAALFVEHGELLQELNWKPWKESKQVNAERVADEFADILAFTGLLLVYLRQLGIDSSMLAIAYLKKSRVNFKRFTGAVGGYRSPTNTILVDEGSGPDENVEAIVTAGEGQEQA